jgi:hypothetical protein
MTADRPWDRYAATWSLDPAARASELPACVTGDVSYCDPNGLLQGQQALSDYMADFQDSVPGGSFAIRSVLHHHDRSMARWTLRGPDGHALQTGTSFGLLASEGRLQAITGVLRRARSGAARMTAAPAREQASDIADQLQLLQRPRRDRRRTRRTRPLGA